MNKLVVFCSILIATCNAASTDNNNLKNLENILKLILQISGSKNLSDHVTDRVAFSAALSHDVTSTTAQEKLIYDSVISNIGNGYDPKTGEFTAPSEGLYVFHWTVLTQPGKVYDTELVVNGVAKRRNAADAGGGKSYNSGSSMVTLLLQKGDKVWIRKYSTAGNNLHGHFWPGFSGFKLN